MQCSATATSGCPLILGAEQQLADSQRQLAESQHQLGQSQARVTALNTQVNGLQAQLQQANAAANGPALAQMHAQRDTALRSANLARQEANTATEQGDMLRPLATFTSLRMADTSSCALLQIWRKRRIP